MRGNFRAARASLLTDVTLLDLPLLLLAVEEEDDDAMGSKKVLPVDCEEDDDFGVVEKAAHVFTTLLKRSDTRNASFLAFCILKAVIM